MNYSITTNSGEMRNLNACSFSISLAFHGILFVLIILFLTHSSTRQENNKFLSASITFSAPKLETIPLHKSDMIGAPKLAVKKEAIEDASVKPKGKKNLIPTHQNIGDPASPTVASLEIAVGNFEHGAANEGRDNRSRPLLLNAQDIKIPYPEQARARRVEGIVKMKLTVAESGKVIEADVISGPAYGLRQAALMVARKLFFLPATDELGRAHVAQIEHEVIFRLTKS